MIDPLYIPILGALLAIACASDVACRRVPNVIVIAMALAGVAAQWASGGPARALWAVLGAAALLAVFFAAWAARKLGGGDLKLAAAVAIWLGPASLVWFVLLTGMAGIPVALAAWAGRRVAFARAAAGVAGGVDAGALPPVRSHTVPLSVAIALGAAAVLWGIR
jgi:prepilin peptidase CpaA